MSQIREKDIIKVQITGIQKYGAFANIDNNYDGLIHISEISYGYVKNINDYIYTIKFFIWIMEKDDV